MIFNKADKLQDDITIKDLPPCGNSVFIIYVLLYRDFFLLGCMIFLSRIRVRISTPETRVFQLFETIQVTLKHRLYHNLLKNK